MELEVLCPQCKRQFTDTNPPRLMTICGHTYCENCLSSWATQEESTGKLKIVCPEDNSEAILENVQQLPKNLALMGVLQSRKNNTSSRSMNSIKDQSFNLGKINISGQEDEVTESLLKGMEQKQAIQEKKQINQQQIPPPLLIRKSDNQPQMCLLHNKQVQLVCLGDHHRLCSKCALFGQHKGHDVVSFEQIEQGNRKIYDGLLKIFDQKELLLDDITSKSKKERLRERLSIKCSSIKKEVAQRFKKIHQQLNRAEKLAYYRLEQLVQSVQKKMRRYLILDDKIIGQYENWTLQAEKKVNFYQTSTHQGLLDFYLSGAALIDSGKEIIKQLKQQQRQSSNEASRFIDDIGVSFNDSNLISSINKIAELYQNEKEWQKKETAQKQNSKIFANLQFYQDIKKGLKTQTHDDDESLLELVDQFQTKSHHNRSISSTILNESMIKIDQQKPTPAKMVKQSTNGTPSRLQTRKKISSVLMKQQKKQERKEEKKEGGLSKQAIKKKMKSIKMPQKYQKILEGLLSDALDTIDFTNAELGDAICFQICDMLKNNVRAKTLKLIRNKITDEGFTKFLPFLTGISTLNLSQNLLTESCLNMIAEYRQNLPNLRALILSQNKIAERKCKPLLQRLRKMDLTVSI